MCQVVSSILVFLVSVLNKSPFYCLFSNPLRFLQSLAKRVAHRAMAWTWHVFWPMPPTWWKPKRRHVSGSCLKSVLKGAKETCQVIIKVFQGSQEVLFSVPQVVFFLYWILVLNKTHWSLQTSLQDTDHAASVHSSSPIQPICALPADGKEARWHGSLCFRMHPNAFCWWKQATPSEGYFGGTTKLWKSRKYYFLWILTRKFTPACPLIAGTWL